MIHRLSTAAPRTAAVLLVVLGLAPAALAQLVAPPEDASFWESAHAQFEANLQHPIAAVRAQTLKNVVYFASFSRDMMSFDPDVVTLVRICERDADPENRGLALAALYAVGTPEAMAYLRAHLTPQRTVEVRETVLAVLGEYAHLGAQIAVN